MKFLLLLFTAVIYCTMTSCTNGELEEILNFQKDSLEREMTYLIPQGEHSSGTRMNAVKSSGLKFVVKFDSTARYTTSDIANQGDINKLYGFSDCGDGHHTNSARYGWRWYDHHLEIFAYCYLNGSRKHQLLGTIDIDKEYTFELKADSSKYVFSLLDTTFVMERGCNSQDKSKYKLYPYFGGDEPAPHDIKVYIKEIK